MPADEQWLQPAARRLADWLAEAALPVWASLGVDAATGAFREGLTLEGSLFDPRRRARVQARQAFVYATAAAEGLEGPWLGVARRAFEVFLAQWRRPDGLFVHSLTPEGEVADPTACLYEHAFILLALEALHRAEPSNAAWRDEALALGARLETFRHGAGGFREAGGEPFQANAQMHLLEAALAWDAADPGGGWSSLADEVAQLALARFIDPATGALCELFDAEWQPLPGEANAIEPGHQFEWAWLLTRWGRADSAPEGLYAAGRRGVDPARGVVVNGLSADLSVRDAAARLWPQAEALRAALALDRPKDAAEAAGALEAFLNTPLRGVWRERMDARGRFLDQPAPATSLYHLTTAILELGRRAL